MNSNLLKTTLVAAAGLLFANSTLAASPATTTFQVTASVADSCLVSATDLNFGAYDPLVGALDGTSTITATCTAGTRYEIGLSAGNGTPATTTRAMTDGASAQLDYELYSDATRTAIWGAPGGATVTQTSLTGGAVAYTVYGRIPASQYVPAANYVDTVTVTVTY